jgi:hypothetical protein
VVYPVFHEPNDCQQEVLSGKIGARRKHHKTRQLQQTKTAVRHQRKTRTTNISRFAFMTFFTGFWAIWFNASCLENFKNGLRVFSSLQSSAFSLSFSPSLQLSCGHGAGSNTG